MAVGFAYTLSPLTIIVLGLLFPLWKWASAGLDDTERRWLMAVFFVAIALRLTAIAGLFLSADSTIPYANFFGDEEFFKRRTTWLRNLAIGIPISPADYFYTFDETGQTSYLLVLTYLQALVGLAPYGVHVLNAFLYLAATVILFRLVRPSLGGLAALGGAAILLFLPSLFIWSISALKEPLYFFVVALNLAAGVAIFRSPRWTAPRPGGDRAGRRRLRSSEHPRGRSGPHPGRRDRRRRDGVPGAAAAIAGRRDRGVAAGGRACDHPARRAAARVVGRS